MAGIGFRLQKILKENTLASFFKTYFIASIIMSGPWLISITCIVILSIFSHHFIDVMQLKLFRTIIVYCYAFSLILVGIIQLMLTRYLADKFFLQEISAIIPSFFASSILTIATSFIIAVIFLSFTAISLQLKVISLILFISISIIWVSCVYLSATRSYNIIVLAFAAGTFVSIFAALFLGQHFHLLGYLSGYTLGQFIIAVGLYTVIISEFPNIQLIKFDFLEYVQSFWTLVLAGLFYNMGIWADKFVFWFAGVGDQINSLFYAHFAYDIASFYGLLTTIPALAIFLVKIETSFYTHYKNFYGNILGKKNYGAIRRAKHNMIKSLKESLADLIRVQAIISAIIIFFAPFYLKFFGLSTDYIRVFRICTLGSFFQVLFLITIILILYFDFRKTALYAIMFFLFTNATFSLISINFGTSFYGFGYAISSFVSCMLAFTLLYSKLKDLEFITFMSQPVSGEEEEKVPFVLDSGYGHYVELDDDGV